MIVFAYEPTKEFRFVVLKLIKDDVIEVGGALRPSNSDFPMCLNIEYLNIMNLAPIVLVQNPQCPKCSKRMKSAGKNQGYRCKKCKTNASLKDLDKRYLKT